MQNSRVREASLFDGAISTQAHSSKVVRSVSMAGQNLWVKLRRQHGPTVRSGGGGGLWVVQVSLVFSRERKRTRKRVVRLT